MYFLQNYYILRFYLSNLYGVEEEKYYTFYHYPSLSEPNNNLKEMSFKFVMILMNNISEMEVIKKFKFS